MRVAVVDDGVLFRRGLVRLLQEEGIEVVAEAGDVEELTRALETTSPDVVVLDIRMPPTYTVEGLDAAASIRRDHPGDRGARPLAVRGAACGREPLE